MRHRILMCKNHPELRWSCKDIAFSPEANDGLGGYNGARRLFFNGVGKTNPDGTPKMYHDGSGLDCTVFPAGHPYGQDDKYVQECVCPPEYLILAPEDKLVIV